MSERAGSSPGHVPKAAPTDFYETRYAPERQRLQDMILREVYDDYFGQTMAQLPRTQMPQVWESTMKPWDDWWSECGCVPGSLSLPRHRTGSNPIRSSPCAGKPKDARPGTASMRGGEGSFNPSLPSRRRLPPAVTTADSTRDRGHPENGRERTRLPSSTAAA